MKRMNGKLILATLLAASAVGVKAADPSLAPSRHIHCDHFAPSGNMYLKDKSSAGASCKSKKSCKGDVAIQPKDFSKSITAQEDFFEYINSEWLKKNPIPGDKSSYGMFNVLDERSKDEVKKILEHAAQNSGTAAKGSNIQLLGDFYKSAMDTAAIEKAGVSPLQKWLSDIQQIQDAQAITRMFSKLGIHDLSTPLGYYVDVDAKNTTRYIMYLNQAGLGLPDRDFYFRTDEKTQKNQAAYRAYIQQLFTLSQADKSLTPAQHMENVYAVEKALAAASMTRVELRDPEKNYNLLTVAQLKANYPNIHWDGFLAEMNVQPNEIVIGQLDFFKAVDSLIVALPVQQWKSYLQFHLMNSTAKYLSQDFVEARFNFYGKTLSGIPSMEPRWKRVSGVMEQYLRDIIGQEYVKDNFSPVAKKRALELVDNIKKALEERLAQLTWMGAETKAKALEKLQKIDVKIGYPDNWLTYERTNIDKQPYVLNVLNGAYAENLRILDKLSKDKIDRTEWGMGPQTVNAYYNPLINEIVFPAAILQPPFFYENSDDAVNYGGIGMVIGHEITHGFDDQGSQFDAEGNLKNWWTEEDRKQYEVLTKRFVEQYNGYSPLDSIYINGELTLGENIADLGGMIISYNAFKKTTAGSNKKISGLTPDQRFFINYAIIWRDHMRPEALRMQVLTNVHSPAKYRVNGVVSNLPTFHKAFEVKEGDDMFIPENKRAVMW